MPIGTSILQYVRGKNAVTDLYVRGEAQSMINGRGDSLVALALPPNAELVRHGESYGVIQGTAVAPVVALPTTTAQVSLWNGEPANGKSYIIDSVFLTGVVSAAAATGMGLVAMINKSAKTLPSGSVLTPFGLAGHNYQGRGSVVLAATVTDDGWHPLGNSVVGPASQIGLNADIPVKGLYVIPPGGLFSIAALANTASTVTTKIGIRWHEVALDLG